MKLAIYARVSTDKCETCGKKPPAHPEIGHAFRGQDPEVQLRELREWCEQQGHTIVEIYVDRGLSGKKGVYRPELERLMVDAEKGRRDFDAVLVWRLSRFGRSVPDLTNQVKRLHAAKVSFISKQEGFDLTTSTGRLVFNVLCSIAEFERDVISENTVAGMKKAKAEGHLPGRKIDPKKGPSRRTVYRQQQRSKENAA
jgi:site-specific DNA recombinase